jgi:hypothetical protein
LENAARGARHHIRGGECMKGIVNTILDMLKKIGYFALQYAYTAFYWLLKLIKIQLQKFKKAGALKKLNSTFASVGSETYALYKQGAKGWESMPSVQQALKMAEEAEADVFKVDQAIEALQADYLRKKEELKENYTLKRTEVHSGYGEESEY